MPQKNWKDWLGFDSARDEESGEEPRRDAQRGDSERVRFTAIAAVAVAVALLVWLLLIRGGDDDSSTADQPVAAEAKAVAVVSESELLGALKGVGYPVYWAGPRVGVEYEVSRNSPDRTYIRYLPKGEEAGSDRPFLTVGSYRQADALGAIQKLGQKPGAILIEAAAGSTAYADGPDATSAYLAFPGVGTQIEVFDPQQGQALSLIRSGAIVPVG